MSKWKRFSRVAYAGPSAPSRRLRGPERAVECPVDRVLAATQVERAVCSAIVVQQAGEDGCDILPRNAAAERVAVDPDLARTWIVGQRAGSDDRPVRVAGADRLVGLRLGAQVDAEHLIVRRWILRS